MHPNPTTPMMKQYLEIKKDYPDAILFYRMGDFYEMFFDDAVTAAPVLDIALTSRNPNDENPIPMCGVPCRASQGYIARLIEHGFPVAICEQTEDPSESKGLVKREVVRVITPGMVVESELLEESSHNYILAVCRDARAWGLSCLDLSTADFRVTEIRNLHTLVEEVERIAPREILIPEESSNSPEWNDFLRRFAEVPTTRLPSDAFDRDSARQNLIRLFHTLSLEGFGCEKMRAGLAAAGAVAGHVESTQKQPVSHIRGIQAYTLSDYLVLDETSRRNLELIQNIPDKSKRGTLLEVMDHTVSSMGARLLKTWILYPLRNAVEIRRRQDAVQDACREPAMVRNIRKFLKQVADLDRIGTRVVMKRCTPRDLLALGSSLARIPEILEPLENLRADLYRTDSTGDLDDLLSLAALLQRAIRDDAPIALHEGGLIQTGYHSGLDELIRLGTDGKNELARLEAEERQRTGIGTLKVRYNKVFGYFIEVSKAQAPHVPAHYIRKQTLVNAERYITEELKEFEWKILGAAERRTDLEYRIFLEICEEVARLHDRIQRITAFLARVDCLLCLAVLAEQNNYARPEINEEGIIRIDEGRHPVIEKMLPAERFIPNSLFMDMAEHQMMVITGPNMAGKSTVLRQTALHVLMAQMGSFIPARKASIAITDRIFTRVGALDNLAGGQSTFLVEMQETAGILHNATPDSLVILDEMGRGTSTYDGFSIAWAIVCYLHDLKGRGVKTLFATHYHELIELEKRKPRVKNFHIAVREQDGEIFFLHKLCAGGTNRSYGIHVARLAGIPDKVISHARNILQDIESGRKRFTGAAQPRPAPSAHEQLRLFQPPENPVITRLQSLDILHMTPLDALNCLNELFMIVQEKP
jgi:DNA mismatch repair protein MutS